MSNPFYLSKILFITPDVIFFPKRNRAENKIYFRRRGKKIDFFAGLLNDLYHLGFDIHIAAPEYRRMFSFLAAKDEKSVCSDIPGNHLHLTKDRIFYYTNDIDVNRDWENIKISLAFQREIIQQLIPRIQPDIVHCHDWMTGLIPAAARRLRIPCIFTVYDIRSKMIPLWRIEEMGIDAAHFWDCLFYDRMPAYYEETRESNLVDLLLSGIFAADLVNVVSMGVASEILACLSKKKQNKTAFRQLLAEKYNRGCVTGCNNDGALNTREYVDLYLKLLGNFTAKPAVHIC